MPADAAGRSVFLTGAANGIGAETARRLVGRGWTVAAIDVDAAGLRALGDELGPALLAIPADVADGAAMEAAAAAALARLGRIDAVVADAAIEVLGSVAALSEAAARRVLEVDLLGVWQTLRVTSDALASSRGYALLVTSVAAATQGPYNWAYSAAKAGVVALGRTYRLEVRDLGIDVGIAYFGYVDTPSGRAAVEHPTMARIMDRMPAAARRPVPVADAADALARAIERRSRRVVVPRSLAMAVELPELAQRTGELAFRRMSIGPWSDD